MHFSMTVQYRSEVTINRVTVSFQVRNISLYYILFKICLFHFLSKREFLRTRAQQDHLISFSWPCILHRAALTFYPPPQGLITKPTDSAGPCYSSLIITVSYFSHLLNIYHTAHVQICLCLHATSVPMESLRALTVCTKQVLEAYYNTLGPCFGTLSFS